MSGEGRTKQQFRERVDLELRKRNIYPYGERKKPLSKFSFSGTVPIDTGEIQWYHRTGKKTFNKFKFKCKLKDNINPKNLVHDKI